MDLVRALGSAVLTVMLVYFLTPWVKRLALKIGAVDLPNERKVHQGVMPRLGGFGIYLGFVAVVLLTGNINREVLGLLLGATMIMGIGIIDDTRGLSPKIKLLGQISAALILVAFGIRVDFLTNPLAGMIDIGQDGMIGLNKLVIPVTVLWVVGVTNAVNLIDGLDGLAAGTASVAALTIAVISFFEGQMVEFYLALVLAGAVMGFLRHNFYPAKIFMGDSGSMFLGFSLSALAIMGLTKGATVISLFTPLVILGIPIMDTLFAILRRFGSRQPIFKADKKHLHHCLLDMGLSHKQTVLVIYAVNVCLGFSAVMLTRLTTEQSMLMLMAITVLAILAANKIGILTSGQIEEKHLGNHGSKDGKYMGM